MASMAGLNITLPYWGDWPGNNTPKRDTHVLQALKVLASAVNLNADGILYRPVFGHKFVSKNEAMQDCRKLLFQVKRNHRRVPRPTRYSDGQM